VPPVGAGGRFHRSSYSDSDTPFPSGHPVIESLGAAHTSSAVFREVHFHGAGAHPDLLTGRVKDCIDRAMISSRSVRRFLSPIRPLGTRGDGPRACWRRGCPPASGDAKREPCSGLKARAGPSPALIQSADCATAFVACRLDGHVTAADFNGDLKLDKRRPR
jgi:hypothetical protein